MLFVFCLFCFDDIYQGSLFDICQSSIRPSKMVFNIFILSLFFQERASVSLLMFSAKQGKYWYHFLNIFFNLGPPTLEASTLPLGYRGGNENTCYIAL